MQSGREAFLYFSFVVTSLTKRIWRHADYFAGRHIPELTWRQKTDTQHHSLRHLSTTSSWDIPDWTISSVVYDSLHPLGVQFEIPAPSLRGSPILTTSSSCL
jgi:hypothetical protein